MNVNMENAIDNCANDFKCRGKITKLQAEYMKEEKQKVRSEEFWNYIQNLNIPGFRDAIEQALNSVE